MQYVTVQGVEVPVVGLGTWQMNGEECRNAVTTGLEQGYRHIDTAQMYGNEDAVGAAVAASDIDRADVFVTTKLDRGNQSDDAVLRSVEQSLERLGME